MGRFPQNGKKLNKSLVYHQMPGFLLIELILAMLIFMVSTLIIGYTFSSLYQQVHSREQLHTMFTLAVATSNAYTHGEDLSKKSESELFSVSIESKRKLTPVIVQSSIPLVLNPLILGAVTVKPTSDQIHKGITLHSYAVAQKGNVS